MATPGFYFTKLEARGRRKPPANLMFNRGLNMISGASDTGKSYIVYCLNYMTGAKKPPKPIPESSGYDSLLLEIRTWDGDVYSLERSLKGKDFRLYECGIDEIDGDTESEILKETRSGSTKSISEFLLELCELHSVQLRTNAKGKTRSISFRDIAHLTIISEERIYTEGSPVRATGQVVNKTVEESLFKYLLTGIDDSGVISEVDTEETEGHRQARIDALENVILSTEQALRELAKSPDEITDQLEKVRRTIDETTTAVALDRERLREEQNRRRELWNHVDVSRARVQVLTRLIDRFGLLERHYDSDLQRLRAMAEAGNFLSQMPISECPVCGTEDPWGTDDDLEQIQRACARETERIKLLHEDLHGTMEDIQSAVDDLQRGIRRSERNYRRVSQQIDETLLPAEEVTKEELATLLETQTRLERAATLVEQIKRLKMQIDDVKSTESKKRKTLAEPEDGGSAKTSETDDFCKVVEKLLTHWKFPKSGHVTFSETN